MRTASDGIPTLGQLRWDLASAMGALHPRMLRLPETGPWQGPKTTGSTGGRRLRVYQYHVRKSAGTSLVFAFFSLAGEDPAAVEARLTRYHFTRSGSHQFVLHDKRLIGRGRYTFASSHLPAWDIEVPVDTITVTVLRDPVSRVVSYYRYLSDARSDDGYAFPAPDSQRRWAADGFDAFLDRITPFHLCNQVHMFSRAGDVGEAADKIAGLSCVLRTEHLAADLDHLGGCVGLPLQAKSERRASTAAPLTDSQRARLDEMLRPEHELLERLPPSVYPSSPG